MTSHILLWCKDLLYLLWWLLWLPFDQHVTSLQRRRQEILSKAITTAANGICHRWLHLSLFCTKFSYRGNHFAVRLENNLIEKRYYNNLCYYFVYICVYDWFCKKWLKYVFTIGQLFCQYYQRLYIVQRCIYK